MNYQPHPNVNKAQNLFKQCNKELLKKFYIKNPFSNISLLSIFYLKLKQKNIILIYYISFSFILSEIKLGRE